MKTIAEKINNIERANCTLSFSAQQGQIYFSFNERIVDEYGIEIEEEEALEIERQMMKIGFAGAKMQSSNSEYCYQTLCFDIRESNFDYPDLFEKVGSVSGSDVREDACDYVVTASIYKNDISNTYIVVADPEGGDTEIWEFEALRAAQKWATQWAYDAAAPE
jgi:hypothetical protein